MKITLRSEKHLGQVSVMNECEVEIADASNVAHIVGIDPSEYEERKKSDGPFNVFVSTHEVEIDYPILQTIIREFFSVVTVSGDDLERATERHKSE